MIISAVTFLRQLSKTVANHSVGLFYTQWSHRYLLYFAVCMIIGVCTFVALELYGWYTWRDAPISFRGNYILHTIINFSLCLYVADEWLTRLIGGWGRHEHRTLGKQALIWGLSFVVAFYIQRTIVFEGIQYYALDTYYYYQKYPQMRPYPLDHFLFSLPFFLCTILLLWLLAFMGQRGLKKKREDLLLWEQSLAAKEEVLRDQMTIAEDDHEVGHLYIQSGSSQIILNQDTISHVTVEDHYCHIHTFEEEETKSYYIKSSLADILDKLPNQHFIQIHRSHVINVQAVRQLDKKGRNCRVYLSSDTVLPVSRYRLSEVMTRIQETYQKKEMSTGNIPKNNSLIPLDSS